MKTIKQVADELGVSKQAVYKRLSGKLKDVCAPYVHTEHSKTLLMDEAVNIVKCDFEQNPCGTKPHTEHIWSAPKTHTERIQSTCGARTECFENAYGAHTDVGELIAENSKLKEEKSALENRVQCLEREKLLLEQTIADLKSDKLDLQKHRDNLTAALTVSKTDLARLENIVMRISSLSLGKRVFGWSGAIAELTMQSDDDVIENPVIITANKEADSALDNDSGK